MSELDPAVTAKADELARWLHDQCGPMRQAAERLTGPDSQLVRDRMMRLAEFTEICAASYQAVRAKLAREEKNWGAYEMQFLAGEVFSCRSALELLAAQVYRHPDYAEDAVTPEEMGHYQVT